MEDDLKMSIWLAVVFATYMQLKVHKRDNFLGSDIEICTFS